MVSPGALLDRFAVQARVAATATADMLIPPLCLSCRTPLTRHHQLCPHCWQAVNFIHPPICDRLGIPLPYSTGVRSLSAAALASPPDYDRARAAAYYDDVVRRMIHELKYGDRHHAVGLMVRWMVQAAPDLLADAEIILPVPLYRWRLWQRRFNQSAILARGVAEYAGKSFQPQFLYRKRATRSQVGLTADQRRRNVSGAFAVTGRDKATLKGRRMLLIDDVITTGATVEACTRALKQAGCKSVDVLVVARVVDPLNVSY